MKKILAQMYINTRKLNNDYVIKSIKETGPFNTILDVGCWDGELSLRYAKAASAKNIFGIEVVKEMSEKAEKSGIKCVSIRADKDAWPYPDRSIDCVVSNQVVEHLSDLDHYFSEASRVLVDGGFCIISTNNLASWHNILALFFGWTPFDLTNSSSIGLGIGNPLSVHRHEKTELASWTHKCIYTPRWLFEWQAQYGLYKFLHMGAGLYPFPKLLGNIFKNHAAFMIITTKKNG